MRLRRFKILWKDQGAHGDGETEPSERRFRTWVLVIAALVGPTLLFALYYRVMNQGLLVPDAMDYAQLGRNISSGKGMVTNVIRPLALEEGITTNVTRQPELVNGPLYPFVLALAFGIAGARDAVVMWVSGLFYLLTIPLLYRLATKVFSRSVALVTVLVFTVNALMLEYAYSGLPLTLEIFLSTWLLLTMYNLAAYARDHEGDTAFKLPRGQLITAGILLGLLYLTDTIFLWFFPAATAWIFWLFGYAGKLRWKAMLTFAGWFVILAAPLVLRYARLGVNPFFGLRIAEVWMNTKSHEGFQAYRLMPGELTTGVGLFKDVVRKVMLGVGQIIQSFPQISASWILAFFLPSLLFRFTDPAANRLRQVMMLMFLSLMVGMLLFGVRMWLFVTTIPTMLAFAVAYLLHLIRQANMRSGSLVTTTALLTMAVVLPLLSVMFLNDKPKDYKHEATAAKGLAKIATNKSEAVFADVPQVVAWYANRPAIYLPLNDIKMQPLRNRFKDVRWVYATERVTGISPEWKSIYTALSVWNDGYVARLRAQETNPSIVLPQARVISGEKSPVLSALEGFYPMPPIKGGRRVGIMGSIRQDGETAPGAGQPVGTTEATQSADARAPALP